MVKKIFMFLPIIVCILCATFLNPDDITQLLGNQNLYIIMFFIALVGWISVFASIPYPLFLATFALGWGNMLLLSLSTVTWVMIWDSISYYFWKKWGKMIEWKMKKIFKILLSFYDNKPQYLSILFFLYGMFSPFPNDLITFSAGLRNYNFFKMILPLSLGNFIFCLWITYFAEYFATFF